MKRTFIFVLTLLALSPAAFAYTQNGNTTTYCPNFTNKWQYSNTYAGGTGFASLNLTQNSSATGSAITGTITNFYFSPDNAYETLTVDSTQSYSMGGGKFIVYATNGRAVFSDVITIPMGAAGCQIGFDTELDPYTGASCYIPAGEYQGTNGEGTTAFIDWIGGIGEFATQFDLGTGSGYSWAGRMTLPAFSGKNGTCTPLLVLTPAAQNVLPSTMNQFVSGQYDVDFLGYPNVASINQIRAQTKVLPCNISYNETEQMDCLSAEGTLSWANFQKNIPVVYTVSNSPPTMTLQRSNAAATEVFGQLLGGGLLETLVNVLILNPILH